MTIKECTYATDILTEDNVCKGVLVTDTEAGSSKPIMLLKLSVLGWIWKAVFQHHQSGGSLGDGAGRGVPGRASLWTLNSSSSTPQCFSIQKTITSSYPRQSAGEGELYSKILMVSALCPSIITWGNPALRGCCFQSDFHEMQKTGCKHVYLDITHKDREYPGEPIPRPFFKTWSVLWY